MHVIKLDGYNATVDNGEKLELGTFDSFGEEQLQIVKAPDWANLSVIATFNPPNRKPVQAVVDSVTGVIKVPKEATAGWYGVGTIVFVGLADGVQRISSDVEYVVRRHSNASGTEPTEPTPSVVEQILTEAQNANVNSAEAKKLATDAKDIAQRVRTDADNGKFNGAKGDTGAAGKDGLTPHIGENGNWWIGDTDTGISAKGVKGDPGADAKVDDSSIGDKPWSSKHIIDMLCPPLEESGNPVVCYPVAGYALGVKAKWEPTQEGSGTPYPAGGGKQLLDTNKCVPTVGKPYGMTITLDGDVFKVSGIPNEEVTTTEPYSFAVCTCNQEELRGKGYKVTAWAIKGKVNNAWGLRTESEGSLAIAAELTPGVNNDIQLRLMVSKDTPTAWEPYENIRPIKGRGSVTVERCGENLLKITPFAKIVNKGVTFEYVAQGGIKISGTATGRSDSPLFVEPLLPPGKYYGLDQSNINASIVVTRDGARYWQNTKGIFDIKTGDILHYWYISINAGTAIDTIVYPYIVPGTTAPTTYTPYIGQTNTLTLPETVYGGEVDAVTGEGNNNTKVITLDGNELKFSQSTSYYNLPFHSAPGAVKGGVVGCSHFNRTLLDVNTNYEFCFMAASDIADLFANVDDLNAYLAAQYAAGTPVQIAYKLATPIPFTATGAQPLPALAGVNTVLTDADSATVTGRADPIKRITDLEDAVASQT